ncbi:pimeloyl-ACP methyl esterase BioG family protein [Stomatohabitans albus]|uniref:pimeloyl-ACP methyl esterase BioG family protein n=1 Tax=Stomatohabitans albus TaxID=3110766 RepID=UPI00300C0074
MDRSNADLTSMHWVHRPPQASTLDIVCLGWSAPASAIQRVNEDHAVVAISNPVNDLWLNTLITDAKDYDNCRITAWSLGVVTASRLLGDISNAQFEAINGVPFPFEGCLDRTTTVAMANALTPDALHAFQMGMCGSRRALQRWRALDGHPDLIRLQQSLAWWIAIEREPPMVRASRWSSACVSSHDRICDPQGQIAQWQRLGLAEPTIVTGAHWLPDALLVP